jgi:hypothetical protein
MAGLYSKTALRDPLFWIELVFRFVGVAFMAWALLNPPMDLYAFSLGAMNYVFSLLAMKKRREINIIKRAVAEAERAMEKKEREGRGPPGPLEEFP